MARHFSKFVFLLLLLVLLCANRLEGVSAAATYRIAAPRIDNAYYTGLTETISRVLAPDVDAQLDTREWDDPTAASYASEADTVDVGVCPSDVHLRYLQSPDRQEISNEVQAFRVVLPLLLEEVHFIVRADSPMLYIHEIANRRAFFGPLGSRAELTGESIYRLLFYREAPLKIRFPIFSPQEQYKAALEALLKRDLDVVLMVGVAPIPLLRDFAFHSSDDEFRLLQMDPEHMLSRKVLGAYPQLTIPKRTYPWCDEDTLSPGVWTYLICLNDRSAEQSEAVRSLVETWCRKLAQTSGRDQFYPYQRNFGHIPLLPEDWQFFFSVRDLFANPSQACVGAAGKGPKNQ